MMADLGQPHVLETSKGALSNSIKKKKFAPPEMIFEG